MKAVAAILAGGHILLNDIPGVGKTTLATALSKSMSLQQNRVQFTPDVLPSDLTGFSIYQKESGSFVYQPGSVMCNLLLADEINRTSPKTQSALLEVMEEQKVIPGDHRLYRFPSLFSLQNIDFILHTGIPQLQTDHKAVKLSLRQHPGSGASYRILGGNHNKRRGNLPADAVHRYLLVPGVCTGRDLSVYRYTGAQYQD